MTEEEIKQKTENERLQSQLTEKVLSEAYSKEIDELGKHIHELQKDKGNLTDVNKLLVELCDKAIEIIKEYLRFTVYTQVSYDPLRQRAEQFLGDEK